MFEVECGACGETFEAKRRNARYCSDRCRKRGQRSADSREPASGPDASLLAAVCAGDPFVVSTRAELVRLDKLDTMLGQQALLVSMRMAVPAESGSAVAALSREHTRLMTILGRSEAQQDPVQAAKDEVARKRAEHHRSAG